MYKYRWVAFLGDRKELQRKTKCYRIRGGALRAKIALPLLQLLSFAEKSRRTTRGPWCLDPPMLGDPKARPTELRMTPAAPLDEDSRATRSRSHTRTSVQQHSIPTVIRSARTASQVASKCCTRTSTVKRRACASRVCVCQRASACDHSQTAVQTQSTLLKNGLDQTPCANVCAQIRVTERAVNTAG